MSAMADHTIEDDANHLEGLLTKFNERNERTRAEHPEADLAPGEEGHILGLLAAIATQAAELSIRLARERDDTPPG